jgi:hypothetical protein
MRSLQRELDDLRESREREVRRAKEDDLEIRALKERCRSLEEERERERVTRKTSVCVSFLVLFFAYDLSPPRWTRKR